MDEEMNEQFQELKRLFEEEINKQKAEMIAYMEAEILKNLTKNPKDFINSKIDVKSKLKTLDDFIEKYQADENYEACAKLMKVRNAIESSK